MGTRFGLSDLEKTGLSVRDYLSKNYPWGVKKCHQDDCFQLRIKDSDADIILNFGSEWRGDRVPRASFQTSRSTVRDRQTDRGNDL